MSVLEKGQERLFLVLQEMPLCEMERHISALRIQKGAENMITGILIGIPIGGMIGIVVMALLNIAKQADISDGIEPSLGQEDRFVVLKNAEEMTDEQEEK